MKRVLSQEAVNFATDKVREIYRELGARPVERNCTRLKTCCHFKLTGRTPYLTKGEAVLAAKALRATGRRRLPDNPDGACPLLHADGDCLIYSDRPFGCRTHFCAAAGGPYSRGEVLDLIRRLERVDVTLDGNGAHALKQAVSSALAELDRR